MGPHLFMSQFEMSLVDMAIKNNEIRVVYDSQRASKRVTRLLLRQMGIQKFLDFA